MGRDLHRMLGGILATFPTATSCLLPLLRDGFPHRRRPVEDQRRYVGHLLRVVSAVPQLFEQVAAVSPLALLSSPRSSAFLCYAP